MDGTYVAVLLAAGMFIISLINLMIQLIDKIGR